MSMFLSCLPPCLRTLGAGNREQAYRKREAEANSKIILCNTPRSIKYLLFGVFR